MIPNLQNKQVPGVVPGHSCFYTIAKKETIDFFILNQETIFVAH